jgi:hypothetical protein
MGAQNPIRHSRLKLEEMTGWKLIAYLRGAVLRAYPKTYLGSGPPPFNSPSRGDQGGCRKVHRWFLDRFLLQVIPELYSEKMRPGSLLTGSGDFSKS